MEAYFFIDPVRGAETLYIPRVLVARYWKSDGRFKLEHKPERLSRFARILMANEDSINRGLEWNLIQGIDVDKGEVDDFIMACASGERKKIEETAGVLYANAYEAIEEVNEMCAFDDGDDDDDDDDDESWKV